MNTQATKITKTKAKAKNASKVRGRGFRGRFDKLVAELEDHPDVRILRAWFGEPAKPEVVRKAGEKLGWVMTDDEVAFYSEMNGCTVVWTSAKDPAFDVKKHRRLVSKPSVIDLENLDTTELTLVGVFAFLPITDMAARPIDYTAINAQDAPPRIAFEIPGQYITPALTMTKKGAIVQVGDDYGACWDGPTCRFIAYVETLLGTWGDKQVRKTIFHDRKRAKDIGKASCTLDALVNPPSPAKKKGSAGLLQKAAKTTGDLMSDDEIAAMMRGMVTKNQETVSTFLARLSEAKAGREELMKAQAPAVVRELAKHQQGGHVATFLCLLDAPYSIEERTMLVHKGGVWTPDKGEMAARGGAAMVPALTRMLAEPADKDAPRKEAIYAAARLGPAAAAMVPVLEACLDRNADQHRHDDPDLSFDGSDAIAYGAAVALVSIDPSRAPELLQHLKLALRAYLAALMLVKVIERLPAKVQDQLISAIDAMARTVETDKEVIEMLFKLGDKGVRAALKLAELEDERAERTLAPIRELMPELAANANVAPALLERFEKAAAR